MAGEAILLVGDVGGTNVRFALARVAGESVDVSDVWKRPSADFPTFDAAIAAYRQTISTRIDGAAFGLAGPVRDGHVDLLHRAWSVDRAELRQSLGVAHVVVVNDFMAMARSAPELGAAGTELIHAGEADPGGSLAVGGPGTGFGIGIVRRLLGADGWAVVGGEGGHQAFAPQTDLEWKLFQLMQAEHGYVSNEMVAAGSGFAMTLPALAEAMNLGRPSLAETEIIPAAEKGDRLALELCRLRARTVMTVMGNMALLSNATGGVFLAGGVSTRIARWLKEREALDRFYRRGLRTGLVSRIPIRLITPETAPLIGAARLWLDEEQRGWL